MTKDKILITTADEPPADCGILPTLAPHNERKHHKHGISKLNYLDACAGFTSRPGTNSAAEDGTRLHEVMEKVIRRVINYGGSSTVALEIVLKAETINEEEDSYLRACCKELDVFLKRKYHALKMEERVYIHSKDGKELTFGHYDTLIFVTETTAVLFDWKFGWLAVPDAEDNLQGMGYEVGCFQKYPKLQKLGVTFVQPKLLRATRCLYTRDQAESHLNRIATVLNRAEDPRKTLRPGPQCDYCLRAGQGCAALINDASRAVAIHEGLPMPETFSELTIETPEQMVKALYVLDRLQALFETNDLKTKAKEMARANGGSISAKVGDKVITFELRSKNSKRSANSPALIADTLKDVLATEQVLSCCDVKITALESIFAEEYTRQQKAAAEEHLQKAEAEAAMHEARGEQEEADRIRADAITEAKAMRATKKQAVEILNSTLTVEGLLTMPENKVEYLKSRVEKQATQIENTNGH